MANNKQNIIDNSLETLQGLKGLKGVNTNNSAESIRPDIQKLLDDTKGFDNVNDKDNYRNIRTSTALNSPFIENIGNEEVGKSRYDEDISSQEQIENLPEARAELQPWYDKVGAGILKGTVLAGTTIADGLIGTIAGIANLDNDGEVKASNFWNNPFSNAMQSINKWSEEALPNYESDEEKANQANGQWYKNIFTANFVGSQFKNLGFMIGAGIAGEITGGLAAGLMGLNEARTAFQGAAAIGKTYEETINAFKTGNKVLDGIELNKQLFAAAKTLKNAEPIVKLAGGLAGSLGWARQSSIQDSEDWFNTQKMKIDDDKNQYAQILSQRLLENDDFSHNQLNANDTISRVLNDEGMSVLTSSINERYAQNIQKITDDRLKMGNVDFALNLPLLTAAEIFQFGRAFSGGYKNARKLAPYITRTVDGIAEKEGAQLGVKDALEQGKTLGYEANLPNKYQQAFNIAKNPIVAGMQLMQMSANAAGAGGKYEKDLDNFLSGKISANSTESADQFISSIGSSLVQGAKDTYSNPSKWEQFVIGAFAGVVGIPGFKPKTEEASNMLKRVTMNGGIWDEMREHKKLVPEVNELVAKLDARVKDPEFVNMYQGVARHNYLEEAKTESAQKGDEFAYKNFEHSQLISDAVMFDKAGRMQDLYDNVEKSSTLKPEDVKQARELAINKETGKSVFDGMTDEEVIAQVKKQGEDMKSTIDNYRKVSDAIKTKTGGQLHDDELEELTWMMTKIDDWENRFHSIHKELKESANKLFDVLPDNKYVDEHGVEHPITDVLNMSPVAMLSALQEIHAGDLASVLAPIYEEANKTLKPEYDEYKDKLDKKINSSDKRGINSIATRLNKLAELVRKNKEASVKFGDMADKMDDMVKLANIRAEFIDKYEGYTRNPDALREMLGKAKTEEAKSVIEKDAVQLNKKVTEAKSYGEFKDAIQSASTPELKAKVLEDAIAANNPHAIEYKKVYKGLQDMHSAIDSMTGATEEQRRLAHQILKSKSKDIENLDTLLDKNTYSTVDDDALWINPKDSSVTSEEDMKKAQDLLGAAVNKAANSAKLEEKYNKVNESQKVADATSESIDETNPSKPKEPELIGGKVDEKEVVAGNNDIAEAMKTLNDPTQTDRHWLQVVHEINVKEYNASKNVVFIGEDASKEAFHAIYNYVKDNGGFDYVNSGKLKQGSKVEFMIDPEWINQDPTVRNGTVFIVQDGVVLGAIDKSAERVSQFGGMVEARDRIWKEYSERNSKDSDIEAKKVDIEKRKNEELQVHYNQEREFNDTEKFNQEREEIKNKYNEELKVLNDSSSTNNGKFIASETNEVSSVYPGRLPFTKANRVLSEIPGIESNEVILGVMQRGQIITNKSGIKVASIKGLDSRGGNNEGRLYLLVKGADGFHYPALVETKRFNSKDFNLDDASIQNTQRYKQIMRAVDKMANSKDAEEFKAHFNELSSYLYLGDFHINFNEDGDGTITVRKATADAGPQTKIKLYDKVEGTDTADDVKDDGSAITFTSFSDLQKEKESARRPAELVSREILDSIQKDGTYLQINKDLLNNGTYNEELIKDNLLSSNLQKYGVVGAGFLMKPKDAQGNIIETPKPETKVAANPAVVISKPEGTTIHYAGTYTVTPEGKIFNDKGIEIQQATESKSQIIKDIAWVQELNSGKYGNTSDKKVKLSWDGKAKEATYYKIGDRVLRFNENGTVDKYVTGHEKEAVLDSLKKKSATTSTPITKSPVQAPISSEKAIKKTPDSSIQVSDHTIENKGNYNPKFNDLDTTKDEAGYYVNREGKVVKDYMRPLGTFVVNGEAIPIHYVKMLYANDEVYASVIDSNGKQVGMGSNLEVLRDVLNKNKDRILTASKEETPLSKLSTPISTEVKVEEVKTEPAKPVVPKSILAPDEPLGDDLMSSANKKRRPKPSEVNTKIWEKWTPERELEHLNKILPNIIKQDLLKIHKGLIEINKGGAEAWGIYKNGLITISDIAVKGTVFHEAFHLVFDKFTDSVHKGDLFREARIKWGDLGNDKLEEKMADVYRDYTMGIIDKSLGQRILDFFKSIFHLSNSNTPQMDKFFWDINKGKYADKEITIDSENKLVKSLDNPEKIHTFANLDTEVKRLLSKKGIDAEIWENLTKEERLNEFKCVTL